MSTKSSSTRGMDDVAVLKRKGYALGKTLGEGSYGKVKSAYSEKLKRNVAVKIIDRKKASTNFLGKFLPREMEILAVMDHKSVVKTYEIFETSGSKIYIIMELGVHGNLLEFIRSRGALPEKVASKLFSQLVTAVKYCHDMDIVHRDLKCENLLLDKDFNIKVTDFGFARRIPRDENDKIILSETYCGTRAYAAPEILQNIPYQPKIYDIWSLGVILFFMVTGSLPYDASNIKKMLIAQKEQQVEYPCSIHVSSECKDLIGRMLQPDVTCRITLEETLNHAWFTLTLQTKLQEISKKEETSYDQAVNLRGKVLKRGRLTPTAETPNDSSPPKRRLLHSMIDKPVIQSEISGLIKVTRGSLLLAALLRPSVSSMSFLSSLRSSFFSFFSRFSSLLSLFNRLSLFWSR